MLRRMCVAALSIKQHIFMSLRQDIFSARDTAMKAKDAASLSTLRVLCSEIKNVEIDKGHELEDPEVLQVIARQVKQLKDAIKDFSSGGREDLVAQNQQEIELLISYLPSQLPDEDIQKIIDNVIANSDSASNMGKVMGDVMKEVAGRADGSRVRELLQKSLDSQST